MTERPTDISLVAIKFPVTAIASIVHRITGVLLFLGLPPLIWIWAWSLQSVSSFASVVALIQLPSIACLCWIYLSCLAYHIMAGGKHLLMDLGFGEELLTARRLSWGVLLVAVIVSFLFFYLLLLS